MGIPVLPRHPLQRLRPASAIATIVLVIACLIASAALIMANSGGNQTSLTLSPDEGIGDFQLYAQIAERVGEGEAYYEAALTEHRANNYPTIPFVTIRLPTLAWGHALLGTTGMHGLFVMLALGAIVLFVRRFFRKAHLYEVAGGAITLLLGGAVILNPLAPHSHGLLAGLLLSLALFSYSETRWWCSLLLAASAVFVRELALLYVLAWLFMAGWQGRWREVTALLIVIAGFSLALFAHHEAIAALLTADDRASPGWTQMAGPVLPLLSLLQFSFLVITPPMVGAPLAVLPLLGWAALGGRIGTFALIWFAGFMAAMAIFARSDNLYWIMLVLPAYLAGLAFVPRAIRDLLAAARARTISVY